MVVVVVPNNVSNEDNDEASVERSGSRVEEEGGRLNVMSPAIPGLRCSKQWLNEQLYKEALLFSETPEYLDSILQLERRWKREQYFCTTSSMLLRSAEDDAGVRLGVSRGTTHRFASLTRNVSEGCSEVLKKRERWSSQTAFVLASIGALLGPINTYDIPEVTQLYGGFAFFIPFTVCLILQAMSLLRMELCLGQLLQGGFLKCMAGISPRMQGVAIAALLISLLHTWRLSGLAACNWFLFFMSFCETLPWKIVPSCSGLAEPECQSRDFCRWSVNVAKCLGRYDVRMDTFLSSYLNMNVMNTSGHVGVTCMSWQTSICLFLCWLITFVFVAHNIVSEGYMLSLTLLLFAGISTTMTFSLFFRPGASTALAYFFRSPPAAYANLMTSAAVWHDAFRLSMQCLACTSGVLHTLTSYTPIRQNIIANSWWLIGTSLLCSLTYTLLYYCGDFLLWGHVDINWREHARTPCHFSNVRESWGLTFASHYRVVPAVLLYSQALTEIAASNVASIVFHLCVALVCIMAMVIYTETVVTTLVECRSLHVRRTYIALAVCALLGVASLFHTTESSWTYSNWLMNFANLYVYDCIVFFEVCGIGWFYGVHRQVALLGSRRPVLIYASAWLLACVGVALLWHIPIDEDNRQLLVGCSIAYFGVVVIIGTTLAAVSCNPQLPWITRLRCLIIGEIGRLMTSFSGAGPFGSLHIWLRPFALSPWWCFSIKYLIPCFSLIDLITNAITAVRTQMAATRSPHCDLDIPIWLTLIGFVVLAICFFSIIASFVHPTIWDWLAPPAAVLWSIDHAPVKKNWATRRKSDMPSIRFFDGFRAAAQILRLSEDDANSTPSTAE